MTNYRSLLDAAPVNVEDITAIIGPNQSGKTSILQGLHTISFTYGYDQKNELTQLNKVNKRYVDGDLEAKELPIVRAYFALESQDRDELSKILMQGSNATESDSQSATQGPTNNPTEITPDKVSSIDGIQVTRVIDGSYSVNIGDIHFDYPDPLGILRKIRDTIGDLRTETKEDFTRDPNQAHKNAFDAACRKVITDEDKLVIDKSEQMKPFIEFLAHIQIDETLEKKIKTTLGLLDTLLEAYPTGQSKLLLLFLMQRMPRTVYFKIYDRLDDSVTLEELVKNPAQHRTFTNLIQLAELKIETLERIKGDTTQLQQYLQNASGIVTDKLRGVYRQESFDFTLRYADGKLMVFTTDPNVPGILLPPSYGSEGFQWFVGFYINFAIATKSEYKNAILLLDDPGVLLHPTGHKDLLNQFKDYLKDDVRTIYSTHLPSLIPKDSISSVRVTYKEAGRSDITENFWKLSDIDAWAPLRASLGIDLTDSLFLANSTVMLEGPSDVIYLEGFKKLLRVQGSKAHLDSFLLPIGGIDKADYYLRLFEALGSQYIVVLDKGSVSNKIPEEKVLQVNPKNKIRANQQQFDIEDLIENELLVRAISYVEQELDDKIMLEKLNSANDRALTIIGAELARQSRKSDIDKVQLARHVLRLARDNPTSYKLTTENFEELILRIEEKLAVVYK